MMEIFERTDLPALLALSLPILALVTAMALALRRVAMRRGGTERVTGRYGAPVQKSKPEAGPAPPAAPVEPSAEAPKAAKPAELAERIKNAEQKSADAALAPLYLELARLQAATGADREAADTLRKCIRLAAKLGQKETHAGARLELGDLAHAEGDLTTACEHWQIARGLYHDLKSDAALAAAEKRMRGNGCPTDWVLNDF